ncbi:MAG: anhydro-N-acetylmuramic acid kinase [Planctomycetaceae bacterium]|jgi:anhydro-N-acetylmuramic acid kinase|nr:anhydro-N-acetylmuramic acid kinase [Planctomycetaceae bacterium]
MQLFPFSGSLKKSDPAPRWFGGISVSSGCRRIETAMIGIHGRGSGAPLEIRKSISYDVPSEITSSYNSLQEYFVNQNNNNHSAAINNINNINNINAANNISGGERNNEINGGVNFAEFCSLYQHVLRELSSVEEEAIEELLNESHLSKNDVLAIGVYDSGIRFNSSDGLFYRSLCDASFLAEQTGLNIVDSFSSQDVSAGGVGGPVLTLPAWIFLKSESVSRVLLDLGRTARLTLFPRSENVFSYQKISVCDLAPCGSLLDALTFKLTQGKSSIDVGGRLTVQGCQIASLLSEFRNIQRAGNNWNSLGMPVDDYLKTAFRLNGSEYSYQDILCTASCFIAESIVGGVRNALSSNVDFLQNNNIEILVTGACRMHGMLMNYISNNLKQSRLVQITDFGILPETFDAVCTALLTVMAIDNIPSNIPSVTGCETSKPLGKITQGSATNWHRLIQEMANTKPAARNIRSAM